MVRFKNRYTLAEITWSSGTGADGEGGGRQVLLAVRAVVEQMHGDFGAACLMASLNGAIFLCVCDNDAESLLMIVAISTFFIN